MSSTPFNKVRGRVVARDSQGLTLANQNRMTQISISSSELNGAVGDIVEIVDGVVKVLTPNRSRSQSSNWLKRTLDPRRQRGMQFRSQVESGIREYFGSRGFLETRTPLLVPCPGMETHIRPFQIKSTENPELSLFLPTSPEFAMKRLLVGGLEKIFQICPAFRDEPNSVTHHPEFTMLEWYRAYANYEDIMRDTEELFEFLAMKLFGKPSLQFGGKEISVKTPWPRLRVRDLFLNQTRIDLTLNTRREQLLEHCIHLGIPAASPGIEETWDDLYFKIWLNLIEPNLPADQAVFVTRYPTSQAALAVVDQDPDGTSWARRFEVYIGGIEIGNAFDELTDPVEQRKRFIKDMDLREQTYGPSFPKNPLDEGFLEALSEGMPPSGGIAVGVDRMVMLYANEPNIDYTTWM